MKRATAKTTARTTDAAAALAPGAVPVGHLRNLGPASARWLDTVGVRTLADLRKLGAIRAWAKVHDAGFNPTLNLLYALEGALRDEHWGELPPTVKKRLRAAIE